MASALREAKAWVVVNCSGHILASTVRGMRRESILAMTGPEDWRKHWGFWKRQGCRCVRVRIVPEGV